MFMLKVSYVASVLLLANFSSVSADDDEVLPPIKPAADFSSPNLKCDGAHAGWSGDCHALQDQGFLNINDPAPPNQWGNPTICYQTCCVTAKHTDGDTKVTSRELAIWGNNAQMTCLGPNLQAWRSAKEDGWKAAGGGSFTLCLTNPTDAKNC